MSMDHVRETALAKGVNLPQFEDMDLSAASAPAATRGEYGSHYLGVVARDALYNVGEDSAALARSASRFDLKDDGDIGIVPFGNIVEGFDAEMKEAIGKVAPAIGQIRVDANTVAGKKPKKGWSGSGIAVSAETVRKAIPGFKPPPGYSLMLTNQHVASGARLITVTMPDGRKLPAEVAKSPKGTPLMNETADIALLLVKDGGNPLPTAEVELAPPEQGDTVFTAGYPLALPHMSVTEGIMSQPSQEVGADGELPFSVYQFDAAINPGNSGGALANRDGKVIGMNTFTLRRSDGMEANDMSFAMPLSVQFNYLSDVWSGRTPTERGDIGIDFWPFSADGAEGAVPKPGAMVGRVAPGSQAAKLGLKRGDVVTGLYIMKDGVEVAVAFDPARPTDLIRQISDLPAGSGV